MTASQARIRITDHKGEERDLALDPSLRYRLGRAPTCEVMLSDPLLSRQHAEIFFERDAWHLADNKSSNGTFADDLRLDGPVRLRAGLRVRMGECHLDYTPPAHAGDQVSFSDMPLETSGTVMISATDVLRDTAAAATQGEPEVTSLRRRFGIVQKATLELLAHEPMEVLLPRILDLVFDATRPHRAALLSRGAGGELLCRAFRGPRPEQFSISRTIANVVLDRKVSVMTSDAQQDFLGARSVEAQGMRGVMAVPLWNQEEVIGLIYTDSQLTDGAFTDEDLKLLTMLGNIAAIQIQNARLFVEQLEKQRFEKEAQAAAEIQRKLLPQDIPDIPGYRFIGHNSPCHEVGGDYYDCLTLTESRRGIIIADISGKGMGAALLMASLQASYHARVETASSPLALVDLLNTAIHRSAPSNRFATAFVMDLDVGAHRVTYVNAGHAPPPLVVRANGETALIMPGGPPLGVFPGMEYESGVFDLAPGDFLFACSDGVTDAMNPAGEMFGDDRLRDQLATLAGRPPEAVHQALAETLHRFAAGAPQPDDLTIIILQRTP